MDRYALFVDAGYVYAEGGKLCCDTPSRRNINLNVVGFNEELRLLASKQCGLDALRTYWYDGAPGGVRTPTHQDIAALPNVKLRLGSINSRGQQKGVDALIYRDLMTLARERAISDGFLLSGDEDLREGVRAAQDQGVRITVIGISPSSGPANQSRELVFEADESVTLTRNDLAPFFTVDSRPRSTETQPSDTSRIGSEFAEQWLQKASAQEVGNLLSQRPRIPRPLDAELFRHAEHALEVSLHHDDEKRRTIRRAFWDAIGSFRPTSR